MMGRIGTGFLVAAGAMLATTSASGTSVSGTSASAEQPVGVAERTARNDLPLDPVRAAMDFRHIGLSIAVHPETKTISGRGRYQVFAVDELETLAFDLAPRFDLGSIKINGRTLPREAYANPDGLLTIDLRHTLPAGAVINVEIAWSGAPHEAANAPWDGGFTWSKTADGQPWIATSIQGEGCDMFWPCIDHPSSRAKMLDMVVNVPDGLVAAGNGVLISQTSEGGRTSWLWRARDPINYGVTLQIGPYALTEQSYASRFGPAIPLKFWHLADEEEGAGRMLDELASYLDFFESTIGPYPFWDEKAGIAQTPHLGMEHQTINAYGNDFKPDPLGYDWLLQHEFAHEWFANQMTYRSVHHMWLHEGLGTYMQPLYLEWLRGEMHYASEMFTQRQRIIAKVPLVSTQDDAPDYLDVESGWGSDIYFKGSWITHTLRHLIGDEAFFASLTRLVYDRKDPAPGNFAPVLRDTQEFRAILEEEAERDLAWFFDAYLYQGPLPELVALRDGATLHLRWETPSELGFAMPVEVRVGDRIETAQMANGVGRIDLGSEQADYLLDPRALILKADPAITAWQNSQE